MRLAIKLLAALALGSGVVGLISKHLVIEEGRCAERALYRLFNFQTLTPQECGTYGVIYLASCGLFLLAVFSVVVLQMKSK